MLFLFLISLYLALPTIFQSLQNRQVISFTKIQKYFRYVIILVVTNSSSLLGYTFSLILTHPEFCLTFFFKVFQFYFILFLIFFFLATPCGLQDPSSATRGWTWAMNSNHKNTRELPCLTLERCFLIFVLTYILN